jgi:hypothetical protein
MLDVNGEMMWSEVSNVHVSGGVSSTGAVRFSDDVLSVGGFGIPTLTFGEHTIELSEISDGYILSQNADNGEVNWFVNVGGQGHQLLNGITKINDSQFFLYGRVGVAFELSGHVFSNPHPDFNEPFLALFDTSLRVVCQKDIAPSDGDDWIYNVLSHSGNVYSIIHHLIERDLDGNPVQVLGSRQNTVWKTCLPCDTLTSIAETTTTKPTLHLYPNPASQEVRIEVQGSKFEVRSLEVTDMLGHTVMNLKPETLNLELDISGLAPGLYSVAVQGRDGEVLRERLVVGR